MKFKNVEHRTPFLLRRIASDTTPYCKLNSDAQYKVLKDDDWEEANACSNDGNLVFVDPDEDVLLADTPADFGDLIVGERFRLAEKWSTTYIKLDKFTLLEKDGEDATLHRHEYNAIKGLEENRIYYRYVEKDTKVYIV